MTHKILFAIHDWGLGHATRDLVVIRALLAAGHQVGIISCGRALALMQSIFADRCDFYELKDIPKPLGRHPTTFYLRMSLSLPQVFWTFRRECLLAQQLCETQGYDRIISDSRFGVALTDVPSYYLVHSLRQIIPGRPRRLEYLVERNQQRLLRRARAILVPDEEYNGGLAGDLCHHTACDWNRQVKYIGPLSDARLLEEKRVLRCFISVSGAEPQRTILEKLVLRQVQRLAGRVVVALGRPEAPGELYDDGRITIHGFLGREAQIRMMNRAEVIVTRSGYTTLMELAQIGRKALLIPTVGQSEQEYLADYHCRRGYVHSTAQSALDLPRDVAVAESLPGLPRMAPSEASVRRLMAIVCEPKAMPLAPQAQPLI